MLLHSVDIFWKLLSYSTSNGPPNVQIRAGVEVLWASPYCHLQVDKMEALTLRAPSLVGAKALTVKGPVKFVPGVTIKGEVTFTNGAMIS